MDEIKKKRAEAMYARMCKFLDDLDWQYTRNDEDLMIKCTARGEDLPMDLLITCDIDLQMLQIISLLPFEAPEDKRLDFAIAVDYVNNTLVDGCFDFDVLGGSLFFRISHSFFEYENNSLGFETFEYLIFCACGTIDKFNDKFFMLAKGMLTLEKFLESEA